jgi:hypothetical protein
MEKSGSEFGRYRISRAAAAALAQWFAGISIFAVGISALDHEIADDPMKEKTVVEAVFDQF